MAPGADLPHNPRVVDTVPALIVSGFLGSGKTTLVRWLLEDAQRNGVRVAVISNEFGELGIDEAIDQALLDADIVHADEFGLVGGARENAAAHEQPLGSQAVVDREDLNREFGPKRGPRPEYDDG